MNVKTDLQSREDIFELVTSFYVKVRKDDLLGPIFNQSITKWDSHFEHLTDFWESNLFFKKTYTGNPVDKHIAVDAANENAINELHFGHWLNLWFATIDEMYAGEMANLAKSRARNMGTFLHLKIFAARS